MAKNFPCAALPMLLQHIATMLPHLGMLMGGFININFIIECALGV
jgi:hypothetical protein